MLPLGGGHRPHLEVPAITKDGPVDPINLEYLKHVVIKFVTSREYEVSYVSPILNPLPTQHSLHLTSPNLT